MHLARVLCKEYHVIEWVLKTECVGLVNLVDSLDHIYRHKMPKLLEQYEWHSWQKNIEFYFIQ